MQAASGLQPYNLNSKLLIIDACFDVTEYNAACIPYGLAGLFVGFSN